MNLFIKYFVMLLLSLTIFSSARSQNWPTYSSGQNTDPTFDNSSVWHKNMELIKPVNFSGSREQEQIQTGKIKYVVSSEVVYGQFVISTSGIADFTGKASDFDANFLAVPRIQIFDVTDPRNPSIAVEIFLKNPNISNPYDDTLVANKTHYYTFKNTAFWTGGEDGHTYLAANVNERSGVLVDENDPGIEDDIYSRVLIIDLTEALSLVQGAATNKIIIGDATNRNSAYLMGTPGSPTHKVYIGYIPRDDVNFKTYYVNHLSGVGSEGDCQIHTMTCDLKSSVLALSPIGVSKYNCVPNEITTGVWVEDCDAYKSYVDCYMMSTIPDHANLASSSAFVEPTRITTSNGKPICVDVTLLLESQPQVYTLLPHESHGHLAKQMKDTTVGMHTFKIPDADIFRQDTFMLYVGSFGLTKEHLDSKGQTNGLGGAAIFEIDITSGLNQAVITQKQMWEYDDDRTQPSNKKFDPGMTNSVWSSTNTHTVDGLHINRWNHLFVTMDEMTRQAHYVKEVSSNIVNLLPSHYDNLDVSSTDGYKNTKEDYISPPVYIFGDTNVRWGLNSTTPYSLNDFSISDYYLDDRRQGNYLKVWGAHHHTTILGNGSNSVTGGPIGSYETHEVLPDNYSINGRNAAFSNGQIKDLVNELTASASSIPDNDIQPGLNSSHHINTVYGTSGIYYNDIDDDYNINREAYIANYSAGARVIDFKEFIKPPTISHELHMEMHDFEPEIIHERAYFDMIPTQTYNSYDRYFYKMSANHGDNSYLTDDYFKTQLPFLPNYYTGIMDAVPDVGVLRSSQLNTDENFIYAMGVSGKQAPWLKNGGFLVLRYFRDEIGGTISGYDGSGGDMAFREVNLQGDFKITRDLTIAEDAVVTLMPGKENEPGIFSSSSIHRDGGGTGFINVYGTLNISLPDGDNDGTSIVLDATRIQVMNGGKLVFHKIRDDKSEPIIVKCKIFVAGGGTLEVKEGAYVAFNQHLDIYGRFKTLGTITEPIMLVGNLNTSTNKKADFENLYYTPIRITINGYDKLLHECNYEMKYTTYKNLPISIRNSSLYNGFPVDNCTFLDSTRISDGPIPSLNTSLVFLSTDKDTRPIESKKRTMFTNCKFADVGDISSMTKHVENAIRKNGLSAINYRFFGVINCEFDELLRGASFENVYMGRITGSNFTNCKAGSVITSSNMAICDNDYTDCVIGASYTTTSSSTTIFDNDFLTTQVGIGLYHSGEYWLKGNKLDYYCNGIGVWGRSYAILAPKSSDIECPIPPYGDKWYYLGRNHFDYPNSPNEVTKFSMYNYSHDISVYDNLSNVYLRCGFNKFADYSDRHLHNHSSTFKYVDGSNNEFRPSPSYIPRVNTSFISVSGDNMDVSEDPNLSCFNTFTCLDLCNPVPAFGGGPGGDDCEPFCAIKIRRFDFDTNATNSTVLLHFSDSKVSMLDTSISEYKRIEYAKQAFYTLTILDSNSIYIDSLLTAKVQQDLYKYISTEYLSRGIKLFRYNTIIEGGSFNWLAEKYFNKLIGNIGTSEVGVFYPAHYEHYVNPPDRWLGLFQIAPNVSVPYSRRTYIKNDTTNARTLGLVNGFNGWDKTTPSESSYETFLRHSSTSLPISFYLDNEDMTMYRKSTSYGENGWLISSLANWEGYLYNGFLKQNKQGFLFSDKLWWSQSFPLMDFVDKPLGAHYGNTRPYTAEELRLSCYTPLILGCKGLLYDGPYTLSNTTSFMRLYDGGALSETVRDSLESLSDMEFLSSIDAGGDWVREGNEILNLNNRFLLLDSVAKYLERPKDKIYLGRLSNRLELRKVHEFIKKNEETIMNLRLQAWWAKGYKKWYMQDTSLNYNVISKFIDTNGIRTKEVYSTEPEGSESYNFIDSSFYDITILKCDTLSLNEMFYLGTVNRRTSPLILENDTLRFYSGAEFDNFMDFGGTSLTGEFKPTEEWQSYYWKRLGCREITIPFNYCDPENPNDYVLLRVQELKADENYDENWPWWRKERYANYIDTVIGQNSSLAVKFLPGEGKLWTKPCVSTFITTVMSLAQLHRINIQVVRVE